MSEQSRFVSSIEGAGPGAPETVEPVQGRPGAGGHGPEGPGGAAMFGLARDRGRAGAPSARRPGRPDLAGTLATVPWALLWALTSASALLGGRLRRA